MAISIDVLSWCKRWPQVDQTLQKEFLSLQFVHSQVPSSMVTPILVAVIRGKMQPQVSARDIKQVASALWSRARVASPTVVTRTLFVDETIKAYVAIETKEKAKVCVAMLRTATLIFDMLCPKRKQANDDRIGPEVDSRQHLQNTLKRVTFGETQHQQPKMVEDDLALEDLAVIGEAGPVGSSRNYGAAFCTLVEIFHTLMHAPYYRMHDLYQGPSGFLGALVHQLHYYVQLYLPEVTQLLLRIATNVEGDELGGASTTEDLLYLCTHRWFLTVFADVVLKEHIPAIWHRFVAFGWKFVLQLALQILQEQVVGVKKGRDQSSPGGERAQSPGAQARARQADVSHVNHLLNVPPECMVDVISELPSLITDLDATIRRSWFWRPRLGSATLLKLEREHIASEHAKHVILQENHD
jgi:hypothetical protein